MGKTITVWGSSGSGKSVFSCILARTLTKNQRKVIIINADYCTPMFPVWIPDQIIKPDVSIGHVLSSSEIDSALVAGKVTVLKSFPLIGLIGYVTGENMLSYPEIKYDTVLNIVTEASKLVDFVILDCNSYMLNSFTTAAIEAADVIVRILTPDLKGVNYLIAHQPLLTGERFRYGEHIAFAGLARPFHAIDKIGNMVGGWAGLLPYGKEIDRCVIEGNIFNAIDYCNSLYMDSIKKVLEAVSK